MGVEREPKLTPASYVDGSKSGPEGCPGAMNARGRCCLSRLTDRKARYKLDEHETDARPQPSGRRRRGRRRRRRRRTRHHGGGVPLNRNHVFDSNGPEVRVRGTSQQLFEKYLQLGRDATSSGDRVTAESYFQHAEHYFRILNAMNQAAQQNQANGQHQGGRRPQQGQDEQGPAQRATAMLRTRRTAACPAWATSRKRGKSRSPPLRRRTERRSASRLAGASARTLARAAQSRSPSPFATASRKLSFSTLANGIGTCARRPLPAPAVCPLGRGSA